MAITLNGSSGGNGLINSGTAVASTSGTSIDFTGIPSGTKRITVMLSAVSTNGATDLLIQVGNGSIVTSGYNLLRGYILGTTANANTTFTNCIGYVPTYDTSDTKTAQIVLTNVTGNSWIASSLSTPMNSMVGLTIGRITLGSSLDRVRITTSNGTDTFDAGTINILYE